MGFIMHDPLFEYAVCLVPKKGEVVVLPEITKTEIAVGVEFP